MYGATKAKWIDIILSSIFWFLTYSSVLQASKTGIYAGTASVIGKANIFISVIISVIFLKEKISYKSIVSIVIGFIGLLFILGIPNVKENLYGLLWMLSFAFFWSIYMVFTKTRTNKNVRALKDIIYNTLIISNCAIPTSFIASFFFERNDWNMMYEGELVHILYILVLSLFGIVIALSLWHYANIKYHFYKVTFLSCYAINCDNRRGYFPQRGCTLFSDYWYVFYTIIVLYHKYKYKFWKITEDIKIKRYRNKRLK